MTTLTNATKRNAKREFKKRAAIILTALGVTMVGAPALLSAASTISSPAQARMGGPGADPGGVGGGTPAGQGCCTTTPVDPTPPTTPNTPSNDSKDPAPTPSVYMCTTGLMDLDGSGRVREFHILYENGLTKSVSIDGQKMSEPQIQIVDTLKAGQYGPMMSKETIVPYINSASVISVNSPLPVNANTHAIITHKNVSVPAPNGFAKDANGEKPWAKFCAQNTPGEDRSTKSNVNTQAPTAPASTGTTYGNGASSKRVDSGSSNQVEQLVRKAGVASPSFA